MPPSAKILSLATANPPYKISQKDVEAASKHIFSNVKNFGRFLPIYENAAIETRYSSVPLEWYATASTLETRNNLYIETALDLLEKASVEAMRDAKLEMAKIDGIVVVSTSGIATPSLDARLMERMQLRCDIERTPIFGLGCAGGVIGLSRTAQLAKASPDKYYLYLVVELCSLNFLKNDFSKSAIIASALFADGASAAVISCQGNGPDIRAAKEYTWPDSLDVMGWDVINEGLKVVFSHDIPTIVNRDMRRIVEEFLETHDLALSDFRHFLCHPGGAKVVDALESSLGLSAGSLIYSRDTMRNYGNMSAATVMFVLKKAMEQNDPGNYLMTTFGPGFTAALLWLTFP